MKGDFTRVTFEPRNHYEGVLLQQGRVQLDADWNEQVAIETYRDHTTTRDVVGWSGAPADAPGFAVTVQGSSLRIGAGRYYVDGILCENEAAIDFTAQPDLPGAALPAANAPGIYLAFLDVWARHLTVLDEPALREKALGGPDTATRVRTVWQVKLVNVGNVNAAVTCAQFGDAWTPAPPNTAGPGRLRAQAAPPPSVPNDCFVPPTAGYRRLENQLYRVEIHTPGTRGAATASGTATFKWSRDNGSIAARLETIDTNTSVITVAEPGKDLVVGFAGARFIELTDDERELRGEPGVLVEVVAVDGNAITVQNWPGGTPLARNAFGTRATARRWDGRGPVTPGVLLLEDGVQVEFTTGRYETAAWWVIPARSVEGTVEWPTTGDTFRPPAGIVHGYAPLALLRFDGTTWTRTSDCRPVFSPLTEVSVFYVGGDGQEALPDPTQPTVPVALAQPLQVGVARGGLPVSGAMVQFSIVAGGGRLQGGTVPVTVATGADGIASCQWALDATTPSQRVKATLLNAASAATQVPLFFSANLSVAAGTAYDANACPTLKAKGVKTVQAAIDALCGEQGGGGGCTVSVGAGGEFATLGAAVEALLKEQRPSICLCLLPGRHELPGLVIANQPATHVKIAGCGAGSRIVIGGKPVEIRSVASFTLRDVAVEAVNASAPLTFAQCGEVELGSCHLTGTVKGPFVTIAGADRIRIESNVIEAFVEGGHDRVSVVFGNMAQAERDNTVKAAITAVAAAFAATVDPGRFDTEVDRVAAVLAGLTPAQRQMLAASIASALGRLGSPADDAEREGYEALVTALRGPSPATALAARLKGLKGAALRAVPGTALVIMDAEAATSLTDNTIVGTTSLYGPPGTRTLNEDQLKRLAGDRLKSATLKNTLRRLSLRGNRFTRIVVADQVIDQLGQLAADKTKDLDGLYRWSTLAENVFVDDRSRLVSAHCILTANAFAQGPDAAMVVAQSLVVTGTNAPEGATLRTVVARREQAANLVTLTA